MNGVAAMVHLSREQSRRVDQIAIDVYGIPGIVLMENAARNTADVASAFLATLRSNAEPTSAPVLIFCGPGNNGGDGFAIARHLHLRSIPVAVVEVGDFSRPTGDAAINRTVSHRIPIQRVEIDSRALQGHVARTPLMIDAIFGTGLVRPIEGPIAMLIQRLNTSARPILAVDIPSGLDCDTGLPLGPACIRASKTVTFCTSKLGFDRPGSREFTGEVIVADIGAPPEVIARVLAQATPSAVQ